MSALRAPGTGALNKATGMLNLSSKAGRTLQNCFPVSECHSALRIFSQRWFLRRQATAQHLAHQAPWTPRGKCSTNPTAGMLLLRSVLTWSSKGQGPRAKHRACLLRGFYKCLPAFSYWKRDESSLYTQVTYYVIGWF